MRKSKQRKHELKRIRTANKISKKDKLKNRISDNAVMREEMGSNFRIINNIIYTFTGWLLLTDKKNWADKDDRLYHEEQDYIAMEKAKELIL